MAFVKAGNNGKLTSSKEAATTQRNVANALRVNDVEERRLRPNQPVHRGGQEDRLIINGQPVGRAPSLDGTANANARTRTPGLLENRPPGASHEMAPNNVVDADLISPNGTP